VLASGNVGTPSGRYPTVFDDLAVLIRGAKDGSGSINAVDRRRCRWRPGAIRVMAALLLTQSGASVYDSIFDVLVVEV
jgi:hypothetical protein